MADEVDQANDIADLYLRVALSNLPRGVSTSTDGIGMCLYCAADIADPRKRWCDAECRDEWQNAQRKI